MIEDDHDACLTWAGELAGQPDLEWTRVSRSAWSTVWRSDAVSGRLWLKSSAYHRSEGAIHTALAHLAPEFVDEPVGSSVERGWLLTHDGGATAGDDEGVDALDRAAAVVGIRIAVLADYAALQQRTCDAEPGLLAAGLPDRSPLKAGELLDRCIDEMTELPGDDPRHLDLDAARRLEKVIPTVEVAGAELAAGPVPMTFDHNDLTLGNVFALRPQELHHRFFDFAEAVWAHPFGSLLPLLWNVIDRLDLDDRMPLDLRDTPARLMVDGYLGAWDTGGELDDLRRLAEFAVRIAALHRALVWLDLLRDRPDAIEQFGERPATWISDVAHSIRL